MTSTNSLLQKANQAWKLKALYAAIAVSGVLMLFAQWRIASLTPNQFALAMLSGVAIGLGGLVASCLFIKCPTCGARWFWHAVSTKHSGSWLHWLESQESCPVCGAYSSDTA